MYDSLRSPRWSARYRIDFDLDESSPLVTLKSPDLSPDPIIPIDISAGGFCLFALYRPRGEAPFPICIQIGKSAQVDCLGRVAWAEQKPGLMGHCWKMGVLLEFEAGQRDRFFDILKNYLAAKRERERPSAPSPWKARPRAGAFSENETP
ncbi:MAG: hypothetical protein O2807_09085 [bacterium]|nr:hypothetical protein [bacterium]